jgi:hypothetical protein
MGSFIRRTPALKTRKNGAEEGRHLCVCAGVEAWIVAADVMRTAVGPPLPTTPFFLVTSTKYRVNCGGKGGGGMAY